MCFGRVCGRVGCVDSMGQSNIGMAQSNIGMTQSNIGMTQSNVTFCSRQRCEIMQMKHAQYPQKQDESDGD